MFIDILGGVVDALYLASKEDPSPISNGRRLISVIVIILCFEEIFANLENIPFETIIQLVFMLRLRPDVKHRTCDDWQFLKLHIHDTHKKVIREAILHFVQQLSIKKHLLQNEWLFAVPLVHFLHEMSQPFQEEQHAIEWKAKNVIGWRGIKSKTYDSEMYVTSLCSLFMIASLCFCRSIGSLFKQIFPLTKLDPFLLRGFVYICPKRELNYLAHQIPPFYSIANLSGEIQRRKNVNKEEVLFHLMDIYCFT